MFKKCRKKGLEINIPKKSPTSDVDNLDVKRDQFIANISHEIRTPLNGVINAIELLRLTELSSEQKTYLEILNQSSKHLFYIIHDLLDYTVIKNDKITISSEKVNINDLIDEIMIILNQKAETKKVKINYHIYKPVVCIESDGKRIRQILLNLINNSIKFTKNGSITLNITRTKKWDDKNSTEEYLLFEVIDTGIGIPEDKKPLLFQSFVNFNNNFNRDTDGTGLGLYITNNIVSAMNGHIELHSKQNVGTTVRVWIPYKDTFIYHTPENINMIKGKSILLLCRDNSLRENICLFLLAWGISPYMCVSEQDLINFLECGTHFHLFIIEQTVDIKKIQTALNNTLFQTPTILIKNQTDTKVLYDDTITLSQPFKKELLFEHIFRMSVENTTKSHASIDKIRLDMPFPYCKKQKVIIAEDYQHNQQVLDIILRKIGYTDIYLAANGLEVLEIIKTTPVDCILMDIKMSPMDGIECLKEVKKYCKSHKKHMPVVFAVSAIIVDNDRQKYIELGFTSCIKKPYNLETIQEKMNEYFV
jgi:CheY-like chemotaxis protein/two-component sensor histidine kinase